MISETYEHRREAFHFRLAKHLFRLAVSALDAPKTQRRTHGHCSGGRPQNEALEMKAGAKKLRESAPKPLQSLMRVNLCAGAYEAQKIEWCANLA
jgi:hypothetical protein